MDKALVFGTSHWGFESLRARHNLSIAKITCVTPLFAIYKNRVYTATKSINKNWRKDMPRVKILSTDAALKSYKDTLSKIGGLSQKVKEMEAKINALEKIKIGEVLDVSEILTDLQTGKPTYYRVNYEKLIIVFAHDEVLVIT